MKALLTTAICLLLFLALVPVTRSADVPHTINYQGRLTDDLGNPIDTVVAISFQFFDAEIGGNYLWKESHLDVVVTNGLFNVLLGSSYPLTPDILDGRTLWMAIAVGTDPQLEGRVPIVSSAYSIRSEEAARSVYADTAGYVNGALTSGWVIDGDIVHLGDDADFVGIGTSSPGAKLEVNGNLRLSIDSDIEFGSHLNRIRVSGGDLSLEAEDDIWLEPTDRIYIRSASTSSWMLIAPVEEMVGIGTTSPSELLHIVNDSDGGRAFLQIESSHPTNWHEAGLRIKTPQNTWHLRMDDDTNNNIPEGALGLRSQVGVEAMTWLEDGNIGIGTTNPQQRLHVWGNLKVKDTLFAGALPENLVKAENIVDEPGVANSWGNYLSVILTTSYQDVVSRSITVPGPGYVIASGFAIVSIDHGISGHDLAEVGIATTSGGTPVGYKPFIMLGYDVNAGSFTLPISCQNVFTIPSAGTYSYFLVSRKSDDSGGEQHIGIAQLVLHYVPTSYGTVEL